MSSFEHFFVFFQGFMETVQLAVGCVSDCCNGIRKFINDLCIGQEPWQVVAYTFAATCFTFYVWNFVHGEECKTICDIF